MASWMPANALNSVNLNKQPPVCQTTQTEVLAAIRTIYLTLGRAVSNGAGALRQVSWSHTAAQRTRLAAKAANSSWITTPGGALAAGVGEIASASDYGDFESSMSDGY